MASCWGNAWGVSWGLSWEIREIADLDFPLSIAIHEQDFVGSVVSASPRGAVLESDYVGVVKE